MNTFKEFITAEFAKLSEEINDFSFATRELGGFDGLKAKDYLKEPIVSFEPLDVPGQPRTTSPVFINFKDGDGEGGLKGKIMYSLMRKDKLRNPNGTAYKGELKDKEITLRNRKHNKSRTLDDILLGPLSKSSAQPPTGM